MIAGRNTSGPEKGGNVELVNKHLVSQTDISPHLRVLAKLHKIILRRFTNFLAATQDKHKTLHSKGKTFLTIILNAFEKTSYACSNDIYETSYNPYS